jgi:PLP dependent protein
MNELGFLAENIKEIEQSISEACCRSGRIREDILLLPVSKTHPAKMVMELFDLGYTQFGENRVQEMLEKMTFCDEHISWHLIGSLQTNKVRHIIGKTALIHSLDRVSLMEEIDKRSKRAGVITDCLVQINISGEDTKSGLALSYVDEFLKKAQEHENIRIQGLMTIGLFTENKNAIRSMFQAMQCKFIDISSKKMHNINMKHLSMGMSSDYVEAIEFGATILRIGTMIFGKRD